MKATDGHIMPSDHDSPSGAAETAAPASIPGSAREPLGRSTSAHEAALERRIGELTDEIIEMIHGARAICTMSRAPTPWTWEGADADGFRCAIEWAGRHLPNTAENALALSDFVANPLEDEAESEAEPVA